MTCTPELCGLEVAATLGVTVLEIEVTTTGDDELRTDEKEGITTETLGRTGCGNKMHPSILLTSSTLTAKNLPATK